MRELISLIKVDINTTFGISSMKYKYFKQKKELWQPIVLVVAMLSLLPAYGLFLAALQGMYVAFKGINQEGVLLLLGFMVSQIIIFVFGIIYVMSKFYFSNDLQLLIPLPIRPSTIISSKFISLIVNEYITVLPIVTPFVVIYGLNNGGSIIYWLASILIFIALPIIPLGLSSLIVILFMRITNIKGRRDLLRVVGFILVLAVVIGVQVGVQSMTSNLPPGGEQEFINKLVLENNSLLQSAGAAYPPSKWASLALSNIGEISGLLNLSLFVGSSVLVFLLVTILGEKWFFGGLIGGGETVAKKRKIEDSELEGKLAVTLHPILSILIRELRILIRTPVFLMNSIGAVIIMPIALMIPTIMSDEMASMFSFAYTREYALIIILIATGIVVFLGASNGVAATTFSREGKQFWISRIVPTKIEHQLIGKLLSAISVQILGVVIILVCLTFLMQIDIVAVLGIVFMGILASIPVIELGMLVDILRPLLDWDNPQKAMKQNLNVLFSMLLGFIYIGIIGALILGLFVFKVNHLVIFIILSIIIAMLSFGLYILLSKTTINRYRDIE